jgi:hypothetical protein
VEGDDGPVVPDPGVAGSEDPKSGETDPPAAV